MSDSKGEEEVAVPVPISNNEQQQQSVENENPPTQQHSIPEPETTGAAATTTTTASDDNKSTKPDSVSVAPSDSLVKPTDGIDTDLSNQHNQSQELDVQPITEPEHPPAIALPLPESSHIKPEAADGEEHKNKGNEQAIAEPPTLTDNGNPASKHSFLLDDHMYQGNESGTEHDQSNFMKELENFFRHRSMEFKPPKFYGEGLNCLK